MGLSEPETRPAASGNHGINPIFSFSQNFRTSSDPRSVTLYRFCTLTIETIVHAWSICRTLTSDNPMCLIFLGLANPSECRVDLQLVPWGRYGAIDRDRCAPGATGRLPSQADLRCSGFPFSIHLLGPGRIKPPLVAITSPCGYGCKASAMISSLTFGP